MHQLSSLSETIKELNIFYLSILHDGHVQSFDKEELKTELLRGFGVDKRKGEFGTYVPYEIKIQILRDLSSSEEQQKSGSLFRSLKGMVLSKDVQDRFNEIAHDSLFILREELVSNEELEHQIFKKLNMLPEKKVVVKSITEDMDLQEKA